MLKVIRFMAWPFSVLIISFAATLEAGVIEGNNLFRLDLIHYNDFHSRFEETSSSSPICHGNSSCLGGFARLYEGVERLKEEKPNAVLLNAGDSFQGTYWYTLLKWNVTQHFLNMLPHDAHAIGNHEFDDGIAGLVPYLKSLKAPVVAANLNSSSEPALRDLYRPHVVVERNGRKIGIIGIITPDTEKTSSAGKVKFEDPKLAAQREAELLNAQGVDIIILLSHVGLKVDKEIASDYGENIDIIVGGHSHSLLWNGTSPSGDQISGPYPVIVKSRKRPNHKVLVVTASAFSKYLGNISIWFNGEGEWETFEAQPLFLNRSIPENPKIKTLLKPYAERLYSLVSVTVGEATDDFKLDSCGKQECALGNLVADSLLETTKEAKVSNLTHVSFLVRNTLRGSIVKGSISRGDVINTVPFSSKVQTFSLKGKYLWQTFEHCVTTVWEERPFNGPWTPQVAGMKITYNVTKEKGSRVVSIFTKDGEEYKPLNFDEDYQVTTYSFIANGGNSFKMLSENLQKLKTLEGDSENLEETIRKRSPITPYLEGRILILN